MSINSLNQNHFDYEQRKFLQFRALVTPPKKNRRRVLEDYTNQVASRALQALVSPNHFRGGRSRSVKRSVRQQGLSQSLSSGYGSTQSVSRLISIAAGPSASKPIYPILEKMSDSLLKSLVEGLGIMEYGGREEVITKLRSLPKDIYSNKEGVVKIQGKLSNEHANQMLVFLNSLMPKTKLIDLSRCGLNQVPKALTLFGHLESLDLSGNQIKELPKSAIFLEVTELKLSDMPLVSGLKNLYPDIKILHLSNCGITSSSELLSLPSHLSLKKLFLDHNPIEWWDDATKLPALLALSLSHCELKYIPLIQGTFESLVEVDLSYNAIKIFYDLQQYPNLKKINLSHNKIESAMHLRERDEPARPGDTRHLGPMRHLTDLDLSHNPLDELILRYQGNDWSPFTNSYPALERLILSGNTMLPLREDEKKILYGEPPARIEPSTYWRYYAPIRDRSLQPGQDYCETRTWSDGTKSTMTYYNL